MGAEMDHHRRVDRLLDEFREYHRNVLNRVLIFLAVPVLVWSILAFLASLPVAPFMQSVPLLNWASLPVVVSVLCCAALSLLLAAALAAFYVVCFAVVAAYQAWGAVPLWQFAITMFLISWLLLFIGNKLEGRRANLGKRLQMLLTAPLWLLAELLRLFRVRY